MIIRYLEKQTVKPRDCKMFQSWMAFNWLAIQGLRTSRLFIWLVLVCNLNTVESIQLLCIRMKEKKNEPKRLKNSFFYDKLDYCWFSHEVIKNSHWRKFDAPEFFLSWSIRAAENEYSNQFLLRKGSSLFCDHSEPEFLSFCVMRHSWRRWELSRTRRLKKWLIWGDHTLEKVLL